MKGSSGERERERTGGSCHLGPGPGGGFPGPARGRGRDGGKGGEVLLSPGALKKGEKERKRAERAARASARLRAPPGALAAGLGGAPGAEALGRLRRLRPWPWRSGGPVSGLRSPPVSSGPRRPRPGSLSVSRDAVGSADGALPRGRLRGNAAAGHAKALPLKQLIPLCLSLRFQLFLALRVCLPGALVGPAAASLVAPLQRSLEAEGGGRWMGLRARLHSLSEALLVALRDEGSENRASADCC